MELLPNGDLLVSASSADGESPTAPAPRRVTKGTSEYARLLAQAAGKGAARRGSRGAAELGRPPGSTVRDVLSRLGVAEADFTRQAATVAEAAYGGRLALRDLQLMRRADYLPYDKDAEER